MPITQQFELRAYPADEHGALGADHPQVSIVNLRSEGAARGMAGRLAKRVNGPVDLAHAGGEPWPDRYITTANPSAFHAAGYRFERLES